MRISIFIAALLVSFSAFAGGRLIFEPYYNTSIGNENGAKFGLTVYENLGNSGFFYNGWAGFGVEQQQGRSDVYGLEWANVRNGLGHYWGSRFTSELGLELKRGGDCPGICQREDLEKIIYLRGAYKLW